MPSDPLPGHLPVKVEVVYFIVKLGWLVTVRLSDQEDRVTILEDFMCDNVKTMM